MPGHTNKPSAKRLATIIGALSAQQRPGKLVNIGGGFMAFSGPSTIEQIATAARGGVVAGLEQDLSEQLRQKEIQQKVQFTIEGEQRKAESQRKQFELESGIRAEESVKAFERSKQAQTERDKTLTDIRRQEKLIDEADRLGVPHEGRPPSQVRQDVFTVKETRRQEGLGIKNQELEQARQAANTRAQEAATARLRANTARSKAIREAAEETLAKGSGNKQRIEKLIVEAKSLAQKMNLFADVHTDKQLFAAEESEKEYLETFNVDKVPENVRVALRMQILRGEPVDFTKAFGTDGEAESQAIMDEVNGLFK